MRSFLFLFVISLLYSQNYPKSKIYNYYKNCTGSVSYVDNSMNSYEQNGLVLSFNNTDYVFSFCSYNDIQEIGLRVIFNGMYTAQVKGIYHNEIWPYLYFLQLDIEDSFLPVNPNYIRFRDMDLTYELLSIGYNHSLKSKIREGYINRKIASENNISLFGKTVKTGSRINDIVVSPDGKLIGIVNKVIGYNTISIVPYEIIKKVYFMSTYTSLSNNK